MPYVVEVHMQAGNLAYELSRMRTWLDHMKFQTVGFKKIADTNICLVDFETEQEAKAFAREFGGQEFSRTAA